MLLHNLLFILALPLNGNVLDLRQELEVEKIYISEQNLSKLELPSGYMIVNSKSLAIKLNDIEKNNRALYSVILKSDDIDFIHNIVTKIIMEALQ